MLRHQRAGDLLRPLIYLVMIRRVFLDNCCVIIGSKEEMEMTLLIMLFPVMILWELSKRS